MIKLYNMIKLHNMIKLYMIKPHNIDAQAFFTFCKIYIVNVQVQISSDSIQRLFKNCAINYRRKSQLKKINMKMLLPKVDSFDEKS